MDHPWTLREKKLYKVLLIPPLWERKLENFLRSLDEWTRKLYQFHCIKNIPRRKNAAIDYEKLLEQCRKIIDEENITVLYCNKNTSAFLKAILCDEYPHLKGPSFESVFLCNHRLYTLTEVDSRSCLPYMVIDVSGDLYDIAFNILNTIGCPGIIRSCLGSGNSVYFFQNRDHLINALRSCRTDIKVIVDQQRWLLNKYVDAEKYPRATDPIVLVQRYLDRKLALETNRWQNVAIEACVVDKKFIPWCVLDAVTLPHGDKEVSTNFLGSEAPTKLNAFLEKCLWEEFEKDAKRLIMAGFDNSFLHAEYFMFEDGHVHLVTINSYVDAETTALYKYVLNEGNNIEAALSIGQGKMPSTPRLNGSYALDHRMFLGVQGKASLFVRYDKTLKNPDVSLHYSSTEEIVIEEAKDVAVLGYISVQGENFEECLAKVKSTRAEILQFPEVVPMASVQQGH